MPGQHDLGDTAGLTHQRLVLVEVGKAQQGRPGLARAHEFARASDLEVAAGPREVAISLKEVRLSASIAVTHKHGIGSCKGTLKASPQGLVYETDHTGDAFSVAMADIETFEVDYLAKNLKLKVKKGKTWNFADPDGNADRLFIFHRDVDKARQRLIAK